MSTLGDNSCSLRTLYNGGDALSLEVAGGFDGILGGQCSASFLVVFLATLVQLSAPILCLSLL